MPPDFEKEAYARLLNHNRSPIRRKLKVPPRPLHPMLKEFLQEDWVTVDQEEALINPSTEYIDRNPLNHRRYSSHETVDMGNKSSKTKKKSSKLDKSRYKSSSELSSKSSTNPFDLISKIRMVQPAQSTNPFEEEEDEPEEPDVDPNKEAKEAILRRLEPHIHSATTSAFFRSHQPVFSSESIHQNSILYRSNEILSAGKRNVVRDHLRKEAIPVRIPNARRRSQAGRSDGRYSEPIRPFNMYRQRLGGSFQTLLMNKRSKSQTVGFSASETNISALRDAGGHQTYQDYCPSGFYNRISLLRRRRENAPNSRPNAMKRWKHFWTVNFQRKRKVIDSSNP